MRSPGSTGEKRSKGERTEEPWSRAHISRDILILTGVGHFALYLPMTDMTSHIYIDRLDLEATREIFQLDIIQKKT